MRRFVAWGHTGGTKAPVPCPIPPPILPCEKCTSWDRRGHPATDASTAGAASTGGAMTVRRVASILIRILLVVPPTLTLGGCASSPPPNALGPHWGRIGVKAIQRNSSRSLSRNAERKLFKRLQDTEQWNGRSVVMPKWEPLILARLAISAIVCQGRGQTAPTANARGFADLNNGRLHGPPWVPAPISDVRAGHPTTAPSAALEVTKFSPVAFRG